MGGKQTCKLHSKESKNLWTNTSYDGISPWINIEQHYESSKIMLNDATTKNE